MDSINSWSANAAYFIRRLDTYKETVSRLFPALARTYVDTWSIADVDALSLGLLLECYSRQVIVLDIGTFVGVSTFHFAGHPRVHKVHSIDPNSLIAHEINDKFEMLGTRIDRESLEDLKPLEVAQTALAQFSDERDKIQLYEGVLGSTQIYVKGPSTHLPKKLDVPTMNPTDGVVVVAFVDGLHTRKGVRADLEAVFGAYPHALAVLDDCRGHWGPFIQAGIVDFMENAEGCYHFKLLGDLGPGMAASHLGIVYPDEDAPEVKRTLVEYSELFSARLDPLQLLRREEELIGIVNTYRDAADQLTKENRKRHAKRESELKELKRRYSQLVARYSKRRYKFADTVAERFLRVPGARKGTERKPEP